MPAVIPFPNRPAADPVRRAYDTLAPAYDALTAERRYDVRLEEIVRAAGVAGERYLDLACGTGSGLVAMRERGYTITACDLSREMVRRARLKVPGAEVLVADMRALPKVGAFDLVT